MQPPRGFDSAPDKSCVPLRVLLRVSHSLTPEVREMPIDPNTETLVSLAEAARHLPRRRRGKRPHLSCLYRWSVTGCKGIALETIQVGGTRCTSREALQRFFERLTAQSAGAPILEPPPRARAADVRRAEQVLDRAGI
jgi:hypothetical protein